MTEFSNTTVRHAGQAALDNCLDKRFARMKRKHERQLRDLQRTAAPDLRIEERLFKLYTQERDNAAEQARAAKNSIRAETILWELYQQEKNRANHLSLRCNDLRASNVRLQTALDRRRTWASIKRLTVLKPTPKPV